MVSFFFESPVWLGLCGSFVAAVAGYFWTQTGNRISAYAAIIAAALTTILVIVNLQVVTEREEVVGILNRIADRLQANDRQAVYSYIHPNAESAVQQAKLELEAIEFSKARVTRIKEITINENAKPPTVLAEFNVATELTTRGQKFRVPRFIRVYFSEKDGRWLVVDFEHFEPTQGFRE